MNIAARLCHYNGRLFSNANALRLQSLVVREFKTGDSLASSMRQRVERIRKQSGGGAPFGKSQTVALDSGRAILGGAAAVGLGGLCLYGWMNSTAARDGKLSAMQMVAMWPDHVRQRVQSTYAYLAGGTALATASALSLVRSPEFMRVMAGGGVMAPLVMLAVSIGTGIYCQSIPYPADGSKLNKKHLAWVLYGLSLGGMVAPMCVLGGPLLTRAALYTAGIVGGLSAVAVTAPSDRFLSWGGPLAIGLGVVFVSSIGSMFLSPMGRLGAGLYGISLYGGLFLFSGFLLYDTQMVVNRAIHHPIIVEDNAHFMGRLPLYRPYDPINNSIKILLDTLNIFVRMVAILASGGQRRK